jgi:quinol monooxygenase YgiN
VDAHRAAPHYTKWRETVKDWFDGEIIRHTATPVYPSEDSWR